MSGASAISLADVSVDEERDRLWPKFQAVYPGYDFLQRIASGRKIPIVLLEPIDRSEENDGQLGFTH